jgi:hypothetical protein
MYGFGQAGYSTGGVVTVSGYDTSNSNYNLNQDQLEAAFQQMFPINAPTASDTTEENITQAQLTAAITPTASSFLSGSTQIGNTQVSNTTLATVGLLFIAVLVGVAIVK